MRYNASIALRSASVASRKIPAISQVLQSNTKGFVFRSLLLCPFANLAIEDYIFRHSPPGSMVLLFYRNNKSIVIGRNQNPWIEVNLQRLRELAPQQNQIVHLVRRRSGGGAVYHDRGNANWSFMCDSSEFERDKYANLVAEALRGVGIQEANVNERHDIVLEAHSGSRKVSGSAYKISRQRALHHGTALLNSSLDNISALLRSPSLSFITARGTESVRSAVTNLGINTKTFESAVEQEFRALYGLEADLHPTTTFGQECLEIDEVRKGYDELRVCQFHSIQFR
jgi:lipoate---protein ligase